MWRRNSRNYAGHSFKKTHHHINIFVDSRLFYIYINPTTKYIYNKYSIVIYFLLRNFFCILKIDPTQIVSEKKWALNI